MNKELSKWERVCISRHPERPKGREVVETIFSGYEEISGDRVFGNDRAIITGIGNFQGNFVAFIAQDKGSTTEERISKNFGMVHPEGFRKAARLCRLAERFSLPIFSFIDTPGAFPGLAAEERGQGWAIAENLQLMSSIKTPILTTILSEGCSGGALAIGIGDRALMFQHAYYSVISPEGCASIIWRDSAKKELAAEALRIHAEDLLMFGMIDEIIPEPSLGGHTNPTEMLTNLGNTLLRHFEDLQAIPIDQLVEKRKKKLRSIGAFQFAKPV